MRFLTGKLIAAAAVGILGALLVLGAGAFPQSARGIAPAGRYYAPRAPYLPGEVIVGYAPRVLTGRPAHLAERMAARRGIAFPEPHMAVLRLARGMSVERAISTLRHTPGIAYAVPDYMAHMAGAAPASTTTPTSGTGPEPPPWVPNDPGRSHHAGGWEQMQWNFLADAGVDAPQAWANLIADRHPGGRGVVVAILDTGVAYRNWHGYRKSPDFKGTTFVHPYDFIARNAYALDREGHGTFVAGMVAEATNNGFGLTGLAYGASIMPVRVLDKDGWGDAMTIARGIRYAVSHGAKVINLSLEFDPSVTAADIPAITSALRFAHSRGVVVVAVSGNEGEEQVAYPARSPDVISVGATTRDRCLADYSNGGRRLDLVAPGGGEDASLRSEPDCHPGRNLPSIYQMTFPNPARPGRFGYPGGWFGTSMAAPEVAAAAALVIASHVLGAHPTPDQILARLEQTAQPLGTSRPNKYYGYGLLDAAAATAPGSSG